jgi:hemerythrin-like domain-containing protein
MEATELLMSEHRIFEKVLNTLESAANKLERNEAVRPGFFVDAAQFSKGFTDGCHHRKEEGVLFKAMVHNGVSDSTGPIAVMLAEHEQGRRFIKAMRAAAEEMEKGDSSAAGRVIENARGYVSLLRQHIIKEDNILFPMADQVIPAN